MLLKVTVDGVVYEVEVEVEEAPRPPIGTLFMGGGFVPQHAIAPAAAAKPSGSPGSPEGQGVTAPLAGTVIRVPVKEDQLVAVGDVLVVLEAMKMETEITATAAGRVRAVLVGVGDSVTGGQAVVQIDPGG